MKKKNVLVIAAHPDDEILGCGATMAMHSSRGDEVNTLLFSRGILSRNNSKNIKKKLLSLKNAAIKANKIVGSKKIVLEDFPDNEFDSLPIINFAKIIERELKLLNPDIIYTHHNSDLNIDHDIINRATMIACRPIPESKINMILTFEVNSSTEWSNKNSNGNFNPNYFVKIDYKNFIKKTKALICYKDEMRKWPHPRSIKGLKVLAERRGSIAGLELAEAFSVFRIIKGK